MSTVYSKPSGDVALELAGLLADNASALERQAATAGRLAACPRRRACAVCGTDLAQAETALTHRGCPYVLCADCGHLQTRQQPPPGYPQADGTGPGFEQVYPQRDPAELASRGARIYRPKLDWCLAALAEAGVTAERAAGLAWRELGAGAGGFLAALADWGARDIGGLENSPELTETANHMLGRPAVRRWGHTLHEALDEFRADIWAAFFVLEHTDQVGTFFRTFARQPAGTFLVMAVPCLGLSTLLEDMSPLHSARNLDSVLHTQLFSDRSLARCLELGGLRLVGQWVFGQDMDDFYRLAMTATQGNYAPELRRMVADKLHQMQDEMQGVLDRNLFADARHLLAVRP